MNTTELTGAMLDIYAAMADGTPREHLHIQEVPRTGQMICVLRKMQTFSPSTNWSDGGPLFGRMIGKNFGIHKNLTDTDHIGKYRCYKQGVHPLLSTAHGDTPLIAACRALVLSVYGAEVQEIEVTP